MSVTESFLAVGADFVSAVEALSTNDWSKAGLGEWTVRDLVGHTLRAVTLVRTYRCDQEETAAPTLTASEYFIAALQSIGDPAAVAQRGRDAGAALGDHPFAYVQSEYAATVAAINNIHFVQTPVGLMTRNEYLRSRIVELVVHTNDLQRATDQKAAVDDRAEQIAIALLGEVAIARRNGPMLLAALTGRTPLPPGFSVL
jgi:Mycothiol maleylpyruvate isomerase N-terminal domain